jgi:hypothetical protein
LIDLGSHEPTFVAIVGKNLRRLLKFKFDENSVALESLWEAGDPSYGGQILLFDGFQLERAGLEDQRRICRRLNIDRLVAVRESSMSVR